MARPTFKVKIKKEGDNSTIEGFATGVGIKSFDLAETKTGKPYIKIIFYNEEGAEAPHFIWDKSGLNYKTAEGKEKSMLYNASMLMKYFKAVNPTIEDVDTTDIVDIYNYGMDNVRDLLPTPCDGELKLNYKEAQGQYWNFVVSKNDPVYTNENSPSKLIFKEDELITFTKVVPTPEVEVPKGDDDLPF